MAKKFIDTNHIELNHALILIGAQDEKRVLYGAGSLPDQWFIKLWVIAKFPRVVFATSQSEKKHLNSSRLIALYQVLNSWMFDYMTHWDS